MNNFRYKKGYSLIEVLITILIISILISLSALTYGKALKNSLKKIRKISFHQNHKIELFAEWPDENKNLENRIDKIREVYLTN